MLADTGILRRVVAPGTVIEISSPGISVLRLADAYSIIAKGLRLDDYQIPRRACIPMSGRWTVLCELRDATGQGHTLLFGATGLVVLWMWTLERLTIDDENCVSIGKHHGGEE